MSYKTLRYSAIVIFILFVTNIFYSTYMWQRLIEQGDFLQGQERVLSKRMSVLERNEQTFIVNLYDYIDPPPLSAEQESELKKLRVQHENVKLQFLRNKDQGNIANRDLLYAEINELFKKIKALERKPYKAHTAIRTDIPLSAEQKLEIKKLRIQYDEIHQSLKELGRWDKDKRKEISLSRFGEAAMYIIVPYFIFLIPILLSLLWNRLTRKRAFIGSCVAACYGCLPVYFYAVLFPVKNTWGYGYVSVFMFAGLALLLGIITFGISYIITKRFYKLNY